MVNYTENVVHAHAVDIRPSPLRRPGDEASDNVYNELFRQQDFVASNQIRASQRLTSSMVLFVITRHIFCN